jgi:hypothetical protein
MDDLELRKLIEQLQSEIQNTKTVNEKDQEMLSRLESEIRDILGRSGGNAAEVRPTTIKSLEDGLSHFEETHPTLTMLISQVLDALSSMGI